MNLKRTNEANKPKLRGAWPETSCSALMTIVLAIVACLNASCSEGGGEYSLVVRLQSDIVPEEGFDTVALTLLRLGDENGSFEISVEAEGTYFPARRLGEVSELRPGDYRLILELKDSERDITVLDRPVLVALSENTSVTIPVSRSCVNVVCDEGLACLGGQCVDARCTPETPQFCAEGSLCEADADCVAPASCGVGRCSLGICWVDSSAESGAATTCDSASEWCHPEEGCLAKAGASPSAPGGAAPSPGVTDPSCRNGVVDEGEEGVDCGGDCVPCRDDYDCEQQTQIPVHECRALVEVYRDTGGETTWEPGSGWLEGEQPCAWSNIGCTLEPEPCGDAVCERQRHIVSLEYYGLGAYGTLSPALGNLTELIELFAENYDRGSLSGTIPKELGELTNLQELNLSWNALSGSIPESLGRLTSVSHLNLSINQLSGPIPESLRNLSSASELYLYENRLAGTIPAWFSELDNLQELWLDKNTLTGPIPEELAGMESLRFLRVSRNNLSGVLPTELFLAVPKIFWRNNGCLWTDDCRLRNHLINVEGMDYEDLYDNDQCTPPTLACE